MPEFKEKGKLVNDVIERLKLKLPENTDFSEGEPLRDIIEALMEELDIQYWQLEQVYKAGQPRKSVGEDLDENVAILGITRVQALPSKGKITFFRDTPAETNYYIPVGTLVETLPDKHGISVKFHTIEEAILLQNNTEVEVRIECIENGIIGNIPSNTIKIINNPPLGVESVKNIEPISGGMEAESDKVLLDRAIHILDEKGLGTIDALVFRVKNIPGVRQVSAIDMARGISTVDILVLGDVIPLSQSKKDEINNIIQKTKAGGIDVKLDEPVVKTVDVSVTLNILNGYNVDDVYETVNNSIINYVNNLDIGQTLILNQLRKFILNSNENILDINIATPISNISVDVFEIIRAGTITIQ